MDKPTQRIVSKLCLEVKQLEKELKKQGKQGAVKAQDRTMKIIDAKKEMLRLIYQQNRDARSDYILPDYMAS